LNRPQLAYIDGQRQKRSIIAGVNRLECMATPVDNINVFPVPDHDTGTNMARTMRSAADDLRQSGIPGQINADPSPVLGSTPHRPAPSETLQPTLADFARTYEFLLKHYRSVVSIHISSKLSGTVQSAWRAAENPGAGADASSVASRAQETADAVHVYLCPRTIAYLVKGGRIGRVSGVMGRILGVTPIFEMYRTGEIRVVRKLYRGMNVRNAFAGLMTDGLRRATDRQVLVAGSDDSELTGWLRSVAAAARPDADIMVENISSVIGAHVGPGTAGVAFVNT